MVASSSILLMIFSCAEEEDITQTSEETQALKIESKPLPDLSDAIQKRVEKKPEEAGAQGEEARIISAAEAAGLSTTAPGKKKVFF